MTVGTASPDQYVWAAKGKQFKSVHRDSHVDGFKVASIFTKVQFVNVCVEYVYG